MRFGSAQVSPGQTGQRVAIHSPEPCTSVVVSSTAPLAGSRSVVCTTASSCRPRVLRTIVRPVESGA